MYVQLPSYYAFALNNLAMVIDQVILNYQKI